MKTELTLEQSARLIELGVDASKASATKYEISETETYCGYAREIVVVDGYIDDYLCRENIFTLADILELLPKEIKNVYGDPYGLNLNWDKDWEAAYFNVAQFMFCQGGVLHYCTAPELIDALHELLVWCINNKHIEP